MTGEHTDWKSDLAELFRERRRARGLAYATRRLLFDIVSLAVPRPRIGFLFQDLRHALRLFRNHAATVSITIVGLGLAIAMCTTVFTVLNESLLKSYEMDDPATVMKVERLVENGNSTSWPYSAFVELHQRAAMTAVEASLFDSAQLDPVAGDPPQKPQSILFVSGGYLPMLGGRAEIGRTLSPDDDRPGAAPVVVINHRFWKNHFGSDPQIVGKTLRLGSGVVTVAGVVSSKFTGPVDRPPSFWVPFAAYGAIYGSAAISGSSQIDINVIARATSTNAAEELSSIAKGLPPLGFGHSDVAPQKTTGVQLRRAARIDGPDATGVYVVIAIIFLILGLVLALACANVANLLLAGASTRAREFGVRISMGASPSRLLRQLLSESAIIGLSAGALGFLISLWLAPALTRLAGQSSDDIAPDLSVFAFTTLISLVSGMGAGMAPARFGARSDVSGLLKSQSLQSGSSPKVSRLRKGFIAFQAAASMLLLVTSALFLRAALHITTTDLGFDANRLVTVSVAFPPPAADNAADTQARVADYWRTATERVSALPSVERTSLVLYPPFSGAVAVTNRDHGGSEYQIFDNRTDAEYFATSGMRIVRGRAYTRDEVTAHAPVAVVSESLVRDFLPGVEPIGASMEPISGAGGRGTTIIGVVADSLVSHMRGGGGSGTAYRPIEVKSLASAQLLVRSPEPDHIARDVEAALAAIDPRVRPSSSVMRENVERFMTEPKILASLSMSVALLALLLSVLGIFGVTSFVVGQRTQEVGVRMAIGASSGDVVRLLIRQNIWPVAGGLGVGLGVALLGTRVLTGALSGISPYDPVAIVPAVLLLAGTALVAVAMPALRAARTDPASVLRQ